MADNTDEFTTEGPNMHGVSLTESDLKAPDETFDQWRERNVGNLATSIYDGIGSLNKLLERVKPDDSVGFENTPTTKLLQNAAINIINDIHKLLVLVSKNGDLHAFHSKGYELNRKRAFNQVQDILSRSTYLADIKSKFNLKFAVSGTIYEFIQSPEISYLIANEF